MRRTQSNRRPTLPALGYAQWSLLHAWRITGGNETLWSQKQKRPQQDLPTLGDARQAALLSAWRKSNGAKNTGRHGQGIIQSEARKIWRDRPEATQATQVGRQKNCGAQ